MPRVKFKNVWGSQNSNIDQQRADLFRVVIQLPDVLGGASAWSNFVEFGLTRFPFPEQRRERIGVKYLNQTNFMLGPEEPVGEIAIPVRYAFNQGMHQLLSRWSYLTSNPRTGGQAQTSKVKSLGEFQWLIPNMAAAESLAEREDENAYSVAQRYVLEGCMIMQLRPTEASMTATGEAALVMLEFNLSVDRYYPVSLNNMVFLQNA